MYSCLLLSICIHSIWLLTLDIIGNIALKWWKTIGLYSVELFTSVHYPKCFRQCFRPRELHELTQSNGGDSASEEMKSACCDQTSINHFFFFKLYHLWILLPESHRSIFIWTGGSLNNKDNKSHDPTLLKSFGLFWLRDP